MLSTGTKAPDFSLYDSDRNKVTLSELEGNNVLLLFFPLAFTSVCTAELCSVRDTLSFYNNLDAKVFGISVDTMPTLAKYKAEQNLNFPLLSDFNKKASKAYDCLYDKFGFDMEGVSKRAAFLIDKQGVIRYAEVLENAGEQPDFESIKKTLSEI